MNQLSNKEGHAPNILDQEQSFGKLTEDLAHVEDKLDDCLASLSHYTGYYCLIHFLYWLSSCVVILLFLKLISTVCYANLIAI